MGEGSCINANRVQEILDACFSPCVAVTGELGHTACVGKGYSGSMHQRPPTQLHPPPRGARGATAKCFKAGLSFFFTYFTPQFETVSVLLLGNALCMDKVTEGSCINANRVQEILDACFSPCVAVTGELGHTA